MLSFTIESNHSAVVRTSTSKDIGISIISENMRSNNVSKSISETSTIEMENIDVPASPLHNLNIISVIWKYY